MGNCLEVMEICLKVRESCSKVWESEVNIMGKWLKSKGEIGSCQK